MVLTVRMSRIRQRPFTSSMSKALQTSTTNQNHHECYHIGLLQQQRQQQQQQQQQRQQQQQQQYQYPQQQRQYSTYRLAQLSQIRWFGKKPNYWQSEDIPDHDKMLYIEDDEDKNLIAPLVVCGPPGVGTRMIIKRFLQKHSDLFAPVVSHTNRLPKRDEENGIDFHFVSDREVEEMIFFDEFFEHSMINGKVYGTAYHSIFRVHTSGGPDRREIMDVDMYGVKRFKEVANSVLMDSTGYKLRPKYIFVAPPDLPTLRQRLEVRNLESEADREKLLQLAEQEIHYGMSKAFHARVYHMDIEQAVRDFTEAVAKLYEKFGRKLVFDDVDRLRQPEEAALLRRHHRNRLTQSLDKDAIDPVTPQDSRIIRQARRRAWVEEQSKIKEENKDNNNSTPSGTSS